MMCGWGCRLWVVSSWCHLATTQEIVFPNFKKNTSWLRLTFHWWNRFFFFFFLPSMCTWTKMKLINGFTITSSLANYSFLFHTTLSMTMKTFIKSNYLVSCVETLSVNHHHIVNFFLQSCLATRPTPFPRTRTPKKRRRRWRRRLRRL